MMKKQAIFIAATGQNVGKTTLCLGMLAGFHRRYPRVGFIKPVGQQHLNIDECTIVDKDAVLFKQYFGLETHWSDMSPVIIPSGFTRQFLDGRVSEEDLLNRIRSSFSTIFNNNDYTIVEGTGHIGVGSIVNLNNAKVAATLNLDVVIIAPGGLGSSHDELALNIAMCEKYGVNVKGVILNRVEENKREMILDYFPKALKKWKIPLIGCVPYNEFLDKPTMQDFEALFNTQLLTGKKHHYRHFESFRLVAGSLEAYLEDLAINELVITPATREDIILALVKKHRDSLEKAGKDLLGGLVLTGRHPPKSPLLEEAESVDLPTIYAPVCSYDAMKMITTHTAKIQIKDTEKIEKAINLVEKHLDFDLL